MKQHNVNDLTMSLLGAVQAIFEAEAAGNTAAAPQLERVLAELPQLRLDH